jgi:hypothetical protein
LDRVGLRFIYEKDFPTKEKAAEEFLKNRIFNFPSGKYFGLNVVPLYPEYAFRLEGSAVGVTLRYKSEGRKNEFEPPFGVTSIEPLKEERQFIVFDVDYYTTAKLLLTQLSMSEWINQALHVIKRDSNAFMKA